MTGEVNLTFPVMVNYKTFDTHVFPVFFGGSELSAERTIVSVPAMQMVYFVAVDTQRQIERFVTFSHLFLDDILNCIVLKIKLNTSLSLQRQ